MYKVQAAIDPKMDNLVMVTRWEFVTKDQVQPNDTVNHVYYFNRDEIPDDFFKTSLGYHIIKSTLRKLGL